MRKLPLILILLGFWILFVCPAVQAAENPQSAAASAVNQIVSQAEAFRKESYYKKMTPELEEEKPEVVAEQEEEKLAGEDKGPFFTISKITFEGNTLFTDQDFAQYTSQFINRETSFVQLRNLAKLITNHYRAAGYISSRAYIPPQRVEESTVIIRIVEGKLGKVVVEGNKYFASNVYASAFKSQQDKVLRFQEIENTLYFVNQKPDRKARAYLMAGEEPTTSDLVLKAEETFPFHMYYEFNNRGTKLTHRSRHLIHVDNNNFLGYGDILNTSLALAEQGAFGAGQFDYSFPIESTGTTLGLGGSWSDSLLIGYLKPEEIKGISSTYTPSVTQSFIKKPTFALDGFLGYEIKDSKTTVADNKVNFDRLRILRVGPRITTQDPNGRNVFSADLHWGMPNFLGSNSPNDVNSSTANSGGEFTYWTANAARLQRLPWASYVLLRAGGQLTDLNHPSPEQFRAGGAFSVRGYPEADAVGDYGYNFSAELNFPVPFLPTDWQVPYTKKTWYEAFRLVGFIDGGQTFKRERSYSQEIKDRFLLGTGFRFFRQPPIAITPCPPWPDTKNSTRSATRISSPSRRGKALLSPGSPVRVVLPRSG